MSELLIGQSYYLRFDPKSWDAMQPYPPLGSLYAASYLRSKGFDVSFFDSMLASSETEWKSKLESVRPKIAVLYEDNFNYLSKMCLSRMREAAFRMISYAKDERCIVVVAGSDPTDHAFEYINAGADYVLIGEGEETLAELAAALLEKQEISIKSIPGLAYLSDREVKTNTRRPDIRDLDELPFPAWDLVDIERYRRIWLDRHGYFSINLATTRGCPFHCNWCAKPIWGQRYNVRSPENILDEIRFITDSYHPDHIWFADDIFGLKPGWLRKFAQLVQSEKLSIPYKCLNRVDLLLRPGEIEALRESGCQIVWIGAESGSQKILDAMEKGTQVEQIYEVTKRLHQLGINVGFFLQFGYPGETREDVNKTMKMIRDCLPDDIGISVSYPLPGTPFFARVKNEIGAKQNWVDSQDLAMLFRGPYSTIFYRQLHQVIHKEYRILRNRLGQRKSGNNTDRIDRLPILVQKLSALRILVDKITLPVDRILLSLFEKVPHRGLTTITRGLSREDAARPTPQESLRIFPGE